MDSKRRTIDEIRAKHYAKMGRKDLVDIPDTLEERLDKISIPADWESMPQEFRRRLARSILLEHVQDSPDDQLNAVIQGELTRRKSEDENEIKTEFPVGVEESKYATEEQEQPGVNVEQRSDTAEEEASSVRVVKQAEKPDPESQESEPEQEPKPVQELPDSEADGAEVEIPDNFESMAWNDARKLARDIKGEVIVTNKEAALNIIREEYERRKAALIGEG